MRKKIKEHYHANIVVQHLWIIIKERVTQEVILKNVNI